MDSRLKASLLSWKTKAKARREENKNLKKRVAEGRQSRDYWKEKYMEMVERYQVLELELKKKQL